MKYIGNGNNQNESSITESAIVKMYFLAGKTLASLLICLQQSSQATIYSIGIGLPIPKTTVKCENWGFITQHQSI